MANIRKSTNSKCWRGCGEKGTLTVLGEMHMGETTMENRMEIPKKKKKKKKKIELPYDLAILFLGIYAEKNNNSLQHYLPQPRHRSNLNVH